MSGAGIFVRLAVVLVALVLAAMLAMSAFTVKVPMSSVSTTTEGDTVVTTTCTWLRAVLGLGKECTTTRTPRSK